MNCCVIGHPIGHSLSPFIHSELFKISNIDCSYITADIAPEDLKEKMDFLKGFDCFNVTIPHKSSIMPYLDVIDDLALNIGAVNTVKNDNGTLYGYNTDGYGFYMALDAHGIKLCGKVLILGYGGAALAIAHTALKMGCALTIGVDDINSQKAINFCNGLRETYNCNIDMMLISDIDADFDLVVNATPVGMYPKCDACILSDAQISRTKAVFDAVYNPYPTLLVKKATERGIKALSGMSMLVWQAAKAHSIWYGAEFSVESINEICEKAINQLEG